MTQIWGQANNRDWHGSIFHDCFRSFKKPYYVCGWIRTYCFFQVQANEGQIGKKGQLVS